MLVAYSLFALALLFAESPLDKELCKRVDETLVYDEVTGKFIPDEPETVWVECEPELE